MPADMMQKISSRIENIEHKMEYACTMLGKIAELVWIGSSNWPVL